MPPAKPAKAPAAKAPAATAPAATAPAKVKPAGGSTLDLSVLNKLEAQSLQSLDKESGRATKNAEDAKKDAFYFKVGLASVVASILLYFFSVLYMTVHKYPRLVKWWNTAMRSSSKGYAKPAKDTPAYHLTQVATASENRLFQKLMNLFLVWPNLTQEGATFLMHCIWEFTAQKYASKKVELTAEHWWGGWESYGGGETKVTEEMLTGVGGIFCSNQEGGKAAISNQQAKETLANNWIKSKAWNIWFPFLPSPETDLDAWGSVPAIRQLWDANAPESINGCDEQAASAADLWLLFHGGLCRVAFEATQPDKSSSAVFANFFVGTPRPKGMCGVKAAQGAMQGASGGGMAGMGMLAVPGLGPAGMIGILAITATSAVAGGVLGGQAGKDGCVQKVDEEK